MKYSDDEKLTGYEGMVGAVLYLRISDTSKDPEIRSIFHFAVVAAMITCLESTRIYEATILFLLRHSMSHQFFEGFPGDLVCSVF